MSDEILTVIGHDVPDKITTKEMMIRFLERQLNLFCCMAMDWRGGHWSLLLHLSEGTLRHYMNEDHYIQQRALWEPAYKV